MITKEALEPKADWQKKIYTVIFEADTPSGKLFDVVLIASIVPSVIAVMLDSVAAFAYFGCSSWCSMLMK